MSALSFEFTEEERFDALLLEESIYKGHLLDALGAELIEITKKLNGVSLRLLNAPSTVAVFSEEVRLTWKYNNFNKLTVEAYTSIGTWGFTFG
jgi:hypothetical protein